jgi:hypothetical protein
MFVSNRCSLSNPTQVFESDCLARYGGFLDKSLADAVVGILLETGFALPRAADAALGVARADSLQSLAAQVVAGAHEVNDGPGEVFAIAVCRQVDDAQIDTQRAAVWLYLIRRFAALGDVQVGGAGSPDEIGSANFPGRGLPASHAVLAPSAKRQAPGDRRQTTRPSRVLSDTLEGLSRRYVRAS